MVIYHTYVQTDVRVVLGGMPFWVEHLRRGVELFFIISGFILGLPFAKQYLAGGKQVRLGAYFLRRLTRLEPPYILILCIRAAAMLAATHVLGYIATHLLANILSGPLPLRTCIRPAWSCHNRAIPASSISHFWC